MARTHIGLDIPERNKPDSDVFDIRAKKLEPWIADLPRANLGETARLIYQALKNNNQYHFSHLKRMYFLEKIREPVFYITSAMKKYYVGVNFPLTVKNYKVAAACQEMFMLLATGYKIAGEDLLSNSLFRTDKKLLSKIIHRSLNSLSHVLLTSYRAYEAYPENIWTDIHKLYRFAESHKLTNIEISDAHRKHHLQSTIQAEYLRLLMVHLASPYRLKQGEVGKVFTSMERWATECQLVYPTTDSSHGQFAVNLLGNHPPRSLALTAEKCNTAECRIIDIRNLAATVHAELKNSTNMATTTLPGIEMHRNELSHDLLERLLIAWSVAPKRLFPRIQKNEKLHITLGLSSTHKVISDGSKNRKNPLQHPGQATDKFVHIAQFNSSTISGINVQRPDVWNTIYPGQTEQQTIIIAEPTLDDSQSGLHAEQSYYHIETWAMLNESANGYCIAAKTSNDTNIQVGELIGIQHSGEGHTWIWGIGVVRWMKLDETQNLTLGIEMLTPDAAAIGIKSTFADSDEDYNRTLLLPELPAIKQSATLLTGPVPYRVGNQLTMRILDNSFDIALTKQLQNTGFFAQFEFAMVEHEEQQEFDDNQDPDDFSSNWSIS